ncbi:hypothetical protein DKT77_15855 [Meridianimarinicoccus roseus]|uniref:VPLPA-CTERM sorting domain-containing protein n=1 Tax=Meridianimarinicoccus roseus TaxID=2072018 RepID=A0A2V2LED4_9RHOB|nr:VPLPA-CTERM sorting domain-containing protein [Meridianimarinicoccus roseus]PWR01606.1 hypothetical protein DKT77_15855 [Meridianimarinicoccus roseus]
MRTSFLASGFAAALAAGGASAAPVLQDLTTWLSAPEPETELQSGGINVTPQSVDMGGNGYRAYVSPVPVVGDWVMAGQMRAYSDDDTMGLVLSYGDGSNNIRIGWEGGGDWESEVSPFANGVWIVEETGGVAATIFEDAANFWSLNVVYDFEVSSIGGILSFSFADSANPGVAVASGQATPGRSTDGQVGVYNGSNNTVFSNITIDRAPSTTVVPLPAGLPLLTAGLLGLAAFRRRGG